MSTYLASSQRPVRLILDFDGTLTTTDTLAPLSQIGYSHTASHSRSSPLPPWSSVVSDYLADYKAHLSSYVPAVDARSTITQETAWLNSLKPIEQASADRAIDAGIWSGVTSSEVELAARKAIDNGDVGLRKGWQGLVHDVAGHEGAVVEVVSVNWSRWWIRCILNAGRHEENGVESQMTESVDRLAIYANELPSVAADLGRTVTNAFHTSGADTVMRTSGDKLQCLREGCSDNSRSSEAKQFTIYVGDSETDLECLLEADLGICIRDEKMGSSQKELAQTLARLKLDVGWIGDTKTSHSVNKPNLVWARDFVEINEYMKKRSTSV